MATADVNRLSFTLSYFFLATQPRTPEIDEEKKHGKNNNDLKNIVSSQSNNNKK